ncbi:MAG: hypothetical protein ACXVC6_10000, partial [Bacteroidia bacterium]
MKNIFYFTAIALFSFSAFSQPVNDNCSGAISLGTLGNPAACGGGIMSGTITSVSGDLTGATPENPYLYQFGCVGGGMASPANDVWYSFVVPANGSQVKVVVSGAAFTPNIALWSGSCSSMIGRGCSVGTIGTGTLNVAGLSPGQTYMIQISGNSGETGAFNLKVSAFQDCSNCEIGSNLTVNPLPVNNSYPLGQRVNFCYHITNFSQVNTNWLHGVQISFGSGWDLSSLTTTTFTGCDGQGVWSYYPGGTTSLANGTQWPAGFYYDSKQVGGCNCLDNNPGNNFGDNCTGSISGGTWNFCFSIAVSSTCTPLADLAVTIGTTGDGQSGNWTNAGCANDPKLNFNAALQECCSKNVSINAVNTICIGQTDLLTASGVSSYTWSTGSNLDTISVSPTVNSTYTVSGTDSTGCVSIATKSITVNSLPVLSVTSATICPGAT